MVKQGLFREDLFYRINTIHLEIPPLRERGDDILLFIDTFLRRFTSKYQRPDIRMHEQTIEKLRSYHWPGNIRELQHAIEKAVILCEGNVIRPKDILVKQSWKPQTASVVPNLEEVERQAIETAILQNNGNLTAAAEQLGISRQTLYNKLKRIQTLNKMIFVDISIGPYCFVSCSSSQLREQGCGSHLPTWHHIGMLLIICSLFQIGRNSHLSQ